MDATGFQTCVSCGAEGTLKLWRKMYKCQECHAYQSEAAPSPEQIEALKAEARAMNFEGAQD